MKFNARGGISILELGVYLPALVIAAIVCKRHGFGRSSGWIFTLILCVVRIVGACCQLATYSNQSTGLYEATIILDSIGVSPLLLATLGLLSRCIDSVNSTHKTMLSALHFRVIQLVITIGLILCIIGGTSSISSAGVYTVQTTTKAGVALYIVAYVTLGFVTLLAIAGCSHIASGEIWILWAVIIAMPLILVRIIYSLLCVFHPDYNFNAVTGSVLIHALMAILEEILVVVIYLVIGWTVDVKSKTVHQRPLESRPWKGNRSSSRNSPAGGTSPIGERRTERYSHRRGPIHGLVGMAIAARQENKVSAEIV